MRMRAIVVRETPLLIAAGQARITATPRQIVRVMRVRAPRSTRRVRLATIRTGRRPQIRVAHTINGADLHRVPIIPRRNSAAIRRHHSAAIRHPATLRRREPIPRRAAHTRLRHTLCRLLAVDHREEDIPRVAAVVEIEADRDHTAGNQSSATVPLDDEKKPAGTQRAFFICEWCEISVTGSEL
jgi:hypothetical protein